MRIICFVLIVIALSACATKIEEPKMAEDCWSYIGKAAALRKQKDYKSALEQIEMHNRCDKSDIKMSYYYHLGWTYHEMGEYNKAIAAFTKGLESQPDYVYAFWRRGLSYEKLGEPSKAEADFRLAYETGMKNNSTQFLEYLEKNPEIKEKLVKQE